MTIFMFLRIPFETNLSIILSKLQLELNVELAELLSRSNVVCPYCSLNNFSDVLNERM